MEYQKVTLLKKCPYSELFLSTFSPYFPAYSVRIRENASKMCARITLNTQCNKLFKQYAKRTN